MKILYIVLFLAHAILFLFAIKHKNIINFAPSLAWLTFIIIPFVYSAKYFESFSTRQQLYGISFISIALLLGDFLIIKRKLFENQVKNFDIKILPYLLYILVAIVLFVPIIHIIQTGYSPFFNMVFSELSKMEISSARENYTKFGSPYLFQIISNLTLNIFMPLLIIVLIIKQKYVLSFITLVWSLVYAYNSTAKAPLILILCSILIIIFTSVLKPHQSKFEVGLVLAFVIITFAGISYGNLMLKNIEKCSPPMGVSSSPANISRSCPENIVIGFNPVINTIGYRVFLTPVEVSNYWYQYYQMKDNQTRGLVDIFERNPEKKASNLIGIKYYQKPFPNSYGTSINANASVDADAFSIGGLSAVFFTALLLLLIRVYIGASRINSPPITRIFESLALSLIIFLPFTASIQAILVPQGLSLILLIIFMLRNYKKFRYSYK